MKREIRFLLVILLITATAQVTRAQQTATAPSCEERNELHLLDFWVGSWEVYSGDRQVGTNRIEKILDGCALMEHWTSGTGSRGKSLFYYYPEDGRWKQVWVTENPFGRGGVKEKAHVETLENGGTRFQGTLVTSGGREYLDRTTLVPAEDGTVVQVIEISVDGGSSWKEMFRGVYRRADR